MASTPFDVDYSLTDLGDDFDLDAFLDLSAYEGDQGVMPGLVFFYWLTRGREKQHVLWISHRISYNRTYGLEEGAGQTGHGGHRDPSQSAFGI